MSEFCKVCEPALAGCFVGAIGENQPLTRACTPVTSELGQVVKIKRNDEEFARRRIAARSLSSVLGMSLRTEILERSRDNVKN